MSKKDWEIKTLGEVCRIRTGKKDVNQGNPNGRYPFFTCAREHTYSDEYSFDCEAILIAGNGEVGICHYYKGKFEAYQRTYVLSDFIPEIDITFLYYFVEGKLKDEFRDKKLGNSMPYIRVGMLSSIRVPIPSLAEQKRIVNILNEKFDAIEELGRVTEQQIIDAKELFESRLSQIFTNHADDWFEAKLSHLGFLGRGKSKHRPRNDKSLYGGKYPFVQTGDIRNAPFVIEKYTQTYNEMGLEQSKLWPKGTLCITIAANIAETSILGMDACFPDSVIGFIPKNGNSAFYQYLMMFNKIELQKRGKGSAQDNINLGTFESMGFVIPPDKKQKQIVKELNELSEKTKELEVIFGRKIADLEELKKSYLEQAFSGKM